jgi:hypothetical protein
VGGQRGPPPPPRTWLSANVTTVGTPPAWPGGSSRGGRCCLVPALLPLASVAGSTLTSTSTM